MRFAPVMLAAVGLFLLAGCVGRTVQARESKVAFAEDHRRVFVSVSYTRTDNWHFYRDPDDSPYGSVQVVGIEICDKRRARFYTPPPEGKMLYPFFVRHERGGNILLAPWYNPVVVHDYTSALWDSVRSLDAEFAAAYTYDVDTQRQRRWDYRFDRATDQFEISWSKLPGGSTDIEAGCQVDHGFLVYLLNEQSLWHYLQNAWTTDHDARPAIRIACEAVHGMMKAHDLRWPAYRWNARQQELGSWCEFVTQPR